MGLGHGCLVELCVGEATSEKSAGVEEIRRRQTRAGAAEVSLRSRAII